MRTHPSAEVVLESDALACASDEALSVSGRGSNASRTLPMALRNRATASPKTHESTWLSTRRQIRIWLVAFIVALVVSGLTAFPLESELRFLSSMLHQSWSPAPRLLPGLVRWIDHLRDGLTVTYMRYPFIAYGTDWLAFAHLVIAVAFIGPLRDPVRNVWVIQFGMIACVGIIPLALIAGSIRHIPLGWQLIDMSFGVVGIIPLIIVYRLIRRLERESTATTV